MSMKAAIMLLMAMALLLRSTEAAQYTVGESIGWGLGNDLEKWATQYTFHVGDDLYFPYPSGEHSVLLVREEDYKRCNVENPIASDNGAGDMVITLISSETYFFICGVPGHCEQGLRLAIPVKTASTGTPSASPVTIPPPPPPSPPVEVSTPGYIQPPPLTPPTPKLAPPAYSPPPQLSSPANNPSYYLNNPTFRPNSAMASHPMSAIAHLTILVFSFACAFFVVS